MYIISTELPLSTNTLRVLNLSMVHNDKGVIIWLFDLLQISLGENNVVIPSMMIFCYWVFDMNTVHLPLDCLSYGLI